MIRIRTREEILKNYIDFGFANKMMNTEKRADTLNPKLQLEVLLDIRDLIVEIKDKKS